MTGHPRRDQAMALSLRRVAQGAHSGEIVLQTSAIYLLGANRMHGAAAAQAAVPVVQRLKRAAQEKARAYSMRAAEAARRANARQRQGVIQRSELGPQARRRTEPTRRIERSRPPEPPRRRDGPSGGRSRRPER